MSHRYLLSEIRATRAFLRLSVLRTIEWMDEQVALHCKPDAPRGSVVGKPYQDRYKERGDARGCGDWLHRLLAARTLKDDGKLNVPAFEAILDLNGVAHSKWNRSTPGWQGRLRMSGRMVLAGLLKKNGFLLTPDGEVRP